MDSEARCLIEQMYRADLMFTPQARACMADSVGEVVGSG